VASRGYPLKNGYDAIVMGNDFNWQLRSRRNETETGGAAAVAHVCRHWRRLSAVWRWPSILQI